MEENVSLKLYGTQEADQKMKTQKLKGKHII